MWFWCMSDSQRAREGSIIVCQMHALTVLYSVWRRQSCLQQPEVLFIFVYLAIGRERVERVGFMLSVELEQWIHGTTEIQRWL